MVSVEAIEKTAISEHEKVVALKRIGEMNR
jgi:hypothetical protein